VTVTRTTTTTTREEKSTKRSTRGDRDVSSETCTERTTTQCKRTVHHTLESIQPSTRSTSPLQTSTPPQTPLRCPHILSPPSQQSVYSPKHSVRHHSASRSTAPLPLVSSHSSVSSDSSPARHSFTYPTSVPHPNTIRIPEKAMKKYYVITVGQEVGIFFDWYVILSALCA
jgi:hypothetical protein